MPSYLPQPSPSQDSGVSGDLSTVSSPSQTPTKLRRESESTVSSSTASFGEVQQVLPNLKSKRVEVALDHKNTDQVVLRSARPSVKSRVQHLEKLQTFPPPPHVNSIHSVSCKGIPTAQSASTSAVSIEYAIERTGGSTLHVASPCNSQSANNEERNLVRPWKLARAQCPIRDEFLASAKLARRTDPLSELECLFAQLGLQDEDLLDRADRRDWPAQFHLMKLTSSPRQQDPHHQSMDMSVHSTYHSAPRVRAPKVRKSALPDIKSDDLAVRKLLRSASSSSNHGKDLTSLPTPSFLLLSPGFISSWVLPSPDCRDWWMQPQPDTETDDLGYRRLAQSSGANVLPPPPPFGIPLRVEKVASFNDYTRVHPQCHTRVGRLHPIKDDLAVRNLRKDATAALDRPNSPHLLPVTTANLLRMRQSAVHPSRPPLPNLHFVYSQLPDKRMVEFTV